MSIGRGNGKDVESTSGTVDLFSEEVRATVVLSLSSLDAETDMTSSEETTDVPSKGP